ncbi:MAG: hypothetical protein H7Z42_10595, partial [Roseiflexaceae bacterium]|nr:hypothetical protein [Roseiflexaceae bacterium]
MASIGPLVQRLTARASTAAHAAPTVRIAHLPRCDEPMDAVFQRFQHSYPAYQATRSLDALRATEYAR